MAKGHTATLYGDVEVEWHRDGDGVVTLDVTIPANTTAEVYVPGEAKPRTMTSGKHRLTGHI